MSILTTIFSPFNLLFFIIIAGFTIGKIRIKGISLGIAGILFVSIFVGFIIKLTIPPENTEIISYAQSTMKTFSTLGTSLFVSVIGLQTGFSIKNNSNISMLSFAIGALMSISGVLVMLLISLFDKTLSYPSLLGILCGSLTSTPALSSVCELIDSGGEEAVLGYGGSYLFGVILTVLFAQRVSKKASKEKEITVTSQNIKSKIYPEITIICTAVLLGNFLGSISPFFIRLSVGTTASTLIVGLSIGYIVGQLYSSECISVNCLNTIRNLGLALFLAGTGFSTGTQAVTFNIKTVLYGMIITLVSIFCGLLFCKLFNKRHAVCEGFIIAGGMTSSPAYAAISANTIESSINCFSFSYFGALISLIVALQIIV